MQQGTRTFRARWIFPVEGEPIADGVLVVEDGRIGGLHRAVDRSADVDLGNVAIVPGFVNAHTHLDLDAIPDLPAGRIDQIDWLRRVVAYRRQQPSGGAASTIARNLEASLAAGTTLVADISAGGQSWAQVAAAPVRAVVFAELIGLKRERAMDTTHTAFEWLGQITPEAMVAGCARPGFSPHAPYTTAGWVYERATAAGVPLCTHLAELPEEAELLADGSGRLRDFLEELGAWDGVWEPLGSRSAEYIRRGPLRRADWLVAHGTYLEPDDYWQFRPSAAAAGQRVAIAYCPRTRARFGHRPHPYRALLERGAIVCLGTDSLASAPSLSVLDEMRALHHEDPSLGGPLLLTMATLFGAWALRAETVTGSLKVGKSADLAVIALPDREASDPYSLVLDSGLPVVATAFEGRFLNGPWQDAWT